MPLEFYVARRYITGDQYEAGLRLHRLFRGSPFWPAGYATSMRYGDVGGGYDPDSMALMPRDYLRAMAAVGDPKARRTVWLVCCFDEPAGRDMAWLKLGLGRPRPALYPAACKIAVDLCELKYKTSYKFPFLPPRHTPTPHGSATAPARQPAPLQIMPLSPQRPALTPHADPIRYANRPLDDDFDEYQAVREHVARHIVPAGLLADALAG